MKRAGSEQGQPKKAARGASDRALTKEEAAVYDRQLRVWGVAAQQKMLTSSLLVVGMGGVSCEICKNLILAGLGSVTLMDSGNVAQRDLAANFFLDESSVGSNRAVSSRDNAAELNPFVNVSARTEDAAGQDAEFFKAFDLVIVSLASHADQIRINDMCRATNTMFMSTDVYGLCGSIFADLLPELTYTIEVVGSDQRPEVTASYCPLSEAHGSAWDLVSSSKKVHPLFPVTAVLNKMRASGDDWATAATAVTEESCAGVAALIAGVSEGDVERFALAAHAEFCPSCAILGGIVAQEVVKIVTGRGHPMNNMFFLDLADPKYPGTLHRNGALAAYKLPAVPKSGPAAEATSLADMSNTVDEVL